MNVLVSFKSESLIHGLSRFESPAMVKVMITLICQWILKCQQVGRSAEWVMENIGQAINDTYVHAEYLLSSTVEIDARTGHTQPVWYPTVASVSPGTNYTTADNHMRPEQWYHRYCELAEHLVQHYTRPVVGFYHSAQQDKHIYSVECVEFTNYYITLIARCYNLIEYHHPE